MITHCAQRQRQGTYAGLVTVGLLAAALGMAACNSTAASAAREITYGKDFKYYEEREIDNAMVRLAADVRKLHGVLRTGDTPSAEQRAEVILLLKDMELAASGLKSGRQTSNHPGLGTRADAFIQDVAGARGAVERDPPNYYLAGSIAGSCFVCHQANSP